MRDNRVTESRASIAEQGSTSAPVRRCILTAPSETRTCLLAAGSGQKAEIAKFGAHDDEVSSVECGYLSDAKSFCCCDHRSDGGAEGKVSVLGHEFSNPHPVACVDVFGKKVACCQVTQESDLGTSAEASADEVGHFGDDQRRDDEGSWVGFKQIEASGVVAVIAVDVGVERAGVDDQSDGCTSAARICSMRSEMSSRPLAPAPAARSRRLPGWVPRNVSIASRVRSDTVVPRRSASCRRRASSSSGSFTVVRCMYASIRFGRGCGESAHFAARIDASTTTAATRERHHCGARQSLCRGTRGSEACEPVVVISRSRSVARMCSGLDANVFLSTLAGLGRTYRTARLALPR